MTSSATGKNYFHTLFAVELKIVQAGPRLHIVYLRHSAANIYLRDDDVSVISILTETISRGDGAKVCCSDNIGCWADGRPLNDAGRYITKCGRLTTVIGAVRVAMEVLDKPVINVVRDVHLGVFIEECRVTNCIESFAEIEGNDDNKLIGSEEVGDGV